MPDHLHMLVEGTSMTAHLPDFVKAAKQLSAFVGKRASGETVWQSGYFERVLRDEDDTAAVASYILDNPVRAGLVLDPCAYEFSGSGRYERVALTDYVQLRPMRHRG